MFFSLLVARLLTPVIAAYTLKSDHKVHADGPVMKWYMRLLAWCIAHRWKTIGAGLVVYALSVLAFYFLPTSVFPADNSDSSALTIELPPGVRLEQTAAISARASAIIAKYPEVKSIVEYAGDNSDVRIATIYVELVPAGQRHETSSEFQDKVMRELRLIPDAHIHFQRNSASGGDADLTLFLTGEDPVLMDATAGKVLSEMRTVPTLRDPRINADLQQPEIVIRPRLDLASALGVTVESISSTIRIATLGDLPQNGAKFSLSDRQIPIRVSLLESSRRDLSTLQNLPVPASGGRTVPFEGRRRHQLRPGPQPHPALQPEPPH